MLPIVIKQFFTISKIEIINLISVLLAQAKTTGINLTVFILLSAEYDPMNHLYTSRQNDAQYEKKNLAFFVKLKSFLLEVL